MSNPNQPTATKALAGLVSVILEHNPAAGFYDHFQRSGAGSRYTQALKDAIVVLSQEGALSEIEAKIGVKLPDEVLGSWQATDAAEAPVTVNSDCNSNAA